MNKGLVGRDNMKWEDIILEFIVNEIRCYFIFSDVFLNFYLFRIL